ncbi:MAG: phytanoyl-CoA dioxygenase family protein [Parasphingopyxis sp.]
MFSIFTSMKVFSDPWVGHPRLNRMGLHRKRLKTAQAVCGFRRAQTVRPRDEHERHLLDHGYVAIPDFLAADEFDAMKREVVRSVEASEARTPLPPEPEVWGFGDSQRHDWGFDRFDGSTLNRFVKPGPLAAGFPRNPRFKRLARIVTGKAMRPGRNWIYLTVNGDEATIHDIQRELHRDTFFNAMKYWFFLDSVREEEGPFVYVPDSHKLTPERLAWEEAKADAAVAARIAGNRGGMTGSFRIADADIADLGLPPPQSYPVAQNTLIVANVFGFHRRGDAEPGTRRLALYGNHRPQPFLPFGS